MAQNDIKYDIVHLLAEGFGRDIYCKNVLFPNAPRNGEIEFSEIIDIATKICKMLLRGKSVRDCALSLDVQGDILIERVHAILSNVSSEQVHTVIQEMVYNPAWLVTLTDENNNSVTEKRD